MATMNISLPSTLRDWVESQKKSGQYANNSDYVRDLIRKDQQCNQKIEALQQAITDGLKSGAPKEFDMDSFKKKMLESINDEQL